MRSLPEDDQLSGGYLVDTPSLVSPGFEEGNKKVSNIVFAAEVDPRAPGQFKGDLPEEEGKVEKNCHPWIIQDED